MVAGPLNVPSILLGSPSEKGSFHNKINLLINTLFTVLTFAVMTAQEQY